MNRWLTLVTAGIVALSVSAPVFAADTAPQAPPAKGAKGAGKRAGGRLQAALAKLDLSADQKTKIQAIVKDGREQIKTATAGITDPKEKRKASRPIQKATQDKVMAVLTDAQKKQLQEELAKSKPAKGAKKAKA